jgi:hypothetical protein
MSQEACRILDDDELANQANLSWRRDTEENRINRLFRSAPKKGEFPAAFQTYQPVQAKTFPFQVNKPTTRPLIIKETEPRVMPSGPLMDSVREMFVTK